MPQPRTLLTLRPALPVLALPVLALALALALVAAGAAPVVAGPPGAAPAGGRGGGSATATAPSYLLRSLPVGAPPRVPHLVGGVLDDDGSLQGRELVDGAARVPVPGAADLVGRSGAGWVVLAGSRLLRVAVGADPVVLARGVDEAVPSSDGRLVAVAASGRRVRLVDTTRGRVVAERRTGVGDASPVAVRGRTVLLATSDGGRDATVAWDTRRDALRRVAGWYALRADPRGRAVVRPATRGRLCEEVGPVARPDRVTFRACGTYASVEALGPQGQLLSAPAPGGGLALRRADGRVLFSMRYLAVQDLQSRLVGLAGAVSDSRWESPGVVLLAVDARPPGTSAPVPGIARCSVAGCEWAGEPVPVR